MKLIMKYLQKNILATALSLLTAGALLISGCTKQLDQVSQTQLVNGLFWNNSSDLNTGTNYLYSFLPGFETPLEDRYGGLAMDVFSGTLDQVSDGTRTAPSKDDNWDNAYKLIRAANNILEKSKTITNDNPVLTNYCVAQAHFFRALGYYKLVRAYGDVPYLGHVPSETDSVLYSPRVPRDQIMDSIYADLDSAAANSPQADKIAGSTTVTGLPGSEYGRITRGGALAFESRVALMAGTWNKFHGGTNVAKHLQKAITAAQTVMNEGKYALYTADGANSYLSQYGYAAETYSQNKEVVMARLYGQNNTNNISSESFARNPTTDGTCAATRKYLLTALYSDGLPAGKSPLDSNGKETGLLTDYQNRDPRLVLTSFKVGDPYVSINNAINLTYGNTYYYQQKKYWVKEDFSQGYGFHDYYIIRYAEVLLNYAEATFELNGQIADADLNATINLLRKRATNNDITKLPLLTNAFVAANGLDMRTEIRRERTIELAFEGFNYWDQLRWKTAETEMPQALVERKYFKSLNYGSGATVPKNIDANGYIVMEAAAARKFDPNRDYLWPIPSAQIGLSNGKLIQNPGWQ
ncbi:MAG: RagB/SusD family nutrient uptake outer membrane protein [Niabella sp.]|nr:RagB/SusD family nutrient uptake outer membrane protein [Niabella sp.]